MWNKIFVALCLWTFLASTNAAAKDPLDGHFSLNDKAQMLTDLITHHVENLQFQEDHNRMLTSASDAHQCGQVLKVYDSETIQNVLSQSIEEGGNDLNAQSASMIGSLLLPMFKYGIEIRKLCGKASDYPQVASALCVNGAEGCDSMQSGILMLPLILTTSVEPGTFPEEGTSSIKSGTLAGTFVFHGSMSNSHKVPSNINFKESDSRGVLATTAMLLTSLIGTAVIMPDYLGGGEEAEATFRPFLKRDTYPISAMALLSAAEEAVKIESNCASGIDDAFYMIGHMEGGYAAAAVADALVHKMEKSIYWSSTSHAPFRPASAQMNFFAQQERDGTLTFESRYMIHRLGATYSKSSTTPAMGTNANKPQSQDLLKSSSSQAVLDTLMGEFVQNDIDTLGSDRPLENSWNPAFVSAMEKALDQGRSGPCDASLVSDETSLLCQALMAQDLTSIFETVDYPMTICHSPISQAVSFDNVPKDDDKLSESIVIATPDTPSLPACLQGLLFFAGSTLLNSLEAVYVPVKEKTTAAGECLGTM
jgi:hypothetical protein